LVCISPFYNYQVKPEMASAVAALPYDIYTLQEAAQEIDRQPLSFLRIDRTAAILPEVDEYADLVYDQAKKLLQQDIQSGLYQHDQDCRFFLYRMQWPSTASEHVSNDSFPEGPSQHSQLGLVAAVASADYQDGTVRLHEQTHPQKLADRIAHIKALNAQTGPVLMTHRPNSEVQALHNNLLQNNPVLYDFDAPDGIRHTIWAIDKQMNKNIQETYQVIDALYIADGHHRAEAAVKIDDQGILAILFPADTLHIQAYNRIIKDTFEMSPDQFLAQLAKSFDVRKTQSAAQAEPGQRGQFGLYLAGDWYQLVFDEKLRPADTLAALDVSILQDQVLQPLLGIDDPRSSDRIANVGGSLGLSGLLEQLQHFAPADNGLAFALYPVQFDAFFRVADSRRLMPPKSTWFAPKPRSGMLIRPL